MVSEGLEKQQELDMLRENEKYLQQEIKKFTKRHAEAQDEFAKEAEENTKEI